VTCDVDAHRSLEVAGSVFWGSLGAVKQLFGAQSSLQEEKLQGNGAVVRNDSGRHLSVGKICAPCNRTALLMLE